MVRAGLGHRPRAWPLEMVTTPLSDPYVPGAYMTGVRGGRVRIGVIIAAGSVEFATVGVPNVVYGAGRPAHVRPVHQRKAGRMVAKDMPVSALPAPPSPGYLAPLNAPGENSDSSPATTGAISRARSSGRPTAVGSMTTQTMTVAALPHGGFRLRESLLPVRVRQLVRRAGRVVRRGCRCRRCCAGLAGGCGRWPCRVTR